MNTSILNQGYFFLLFQTSRDLACFIQFENVNIYYGIQCKMKYKAPTDYCFVLKVGFKSLPYICKQFESVISFLEMFSVI